MTEGREAARRPARAPLRQRSRRRWAIVGGVAAGWLVVELVTGSVVSATVLLVALAGLGAAGLGALRAAGITRDHPWMRRIASRPWRDGQDVLQVAMRHLSEVFVITPSGALLAPNVIELRLNPDDLFTLRERMDVGVIRASLAEVYEDQVASHGARFAGAGRAETYVVADESVPPGRYRLRQGRPVGGDPNEPRYPDPVPEFAYAAQRPESAQAGQRPDHADQAGYADGAYYADDAESGGWAWQPAGPGLTIPGGMDTVLERSVVSIPALRLITGSTVSETRMSGARAGRGDVELVLPDVATVSREHAICTFSDGRWWITNQGRNGLTLNGSLVAGEQPLSDGDTIRWGTRPDALLSRVEIGDGR